MGEGFWQWYKEFLIWLLRRTIRVMALQPPPPMPIALILAGGTPDYGPRFWPLPPRRLKDPIVEVFVGALLTVGVIIAGVGISPWLFLLLFVSPILLFHGFWRADVEKAYRAKLRDDVIADVLAMASSELGLSEDKLVVRDLRLYSDLAWAQDKNEPPRR